MRFVTGQAFLFEVRGHDRAWGLGDMSPSGKAAMPARVMLADLECADLAALTPSSDFGATSWDWESCLPVGKRQHVAALQSTPNTKPRIAPGLCIETIRLLDVAAED